MDRLVIALLGTQIDTVRGIHEEVWVQGHLKGPLSTPLSLEI